MADAEIPGHKIFVGDLPSDVTSEEIQTVFSTYGEVTNVHLLFPSPTSQNRAALLHYRTKESAQDAITVLNGVYKIRADAPNPIKVAWARGHDGFKMFVGGLPGDIREEELKTVFGTYGEVTSTHIMPPNQENGRVAAFVYYAKAESGEDAINVLDGKYKIRVDAEQPIQVMWAKSKDKGGGKGGSWEGGGGGWSSWGGSGGKGSDGKCKTKDGWKLFVGGLPKDVSEDEIRTVFSTYGTVAMVHLMPPHAMSGRVASFVFYESEQSADDAIKVLDGVYKIRQDAETPITVKWGTDNRAGGKGGGGGWGGGYGDSSWGKGGKGGGQQALGWGGGGWSQGGGWGQGGGGAWQGGGGGWQSRGGGSWGASSGSWGGSNGGHGGSGDAGNASNAKLFVGNLPSDITEESLRYVFQTYGAVAGVRVMTGRSQSGNACAFVEFAQVADADTAMVTLDGKYEIKPGFGTIMVKKAGTSSQRSRPY